MNRLATKLQTATEKTAVRRWLPVLLTGLGLALATLPVASPYFQAGTVPRTNDVFPHLYRVVALDRLVQAGLIWPRWSPDLVHGFGYPVFNFFPALSHLVVEVFHLLRLPITTAYRTTMLLHIWIAAWATYGLGRAFFGRAGSWAAALAYVYSPYFLYDFHVRGGLPEGQAVALLPLLLLALWRAAENRRGWIIATGLAFAAVLLSHPIIYTLMFPIGAWLLLLAYRRGWRTLIGPIVGMGLGVAATTFFWLPALSEIRYTRANASIVAGYSYQANFLALRQLLDYPPLPVDPALLNPPVVRALPVVVLLWATFRLLWRRRQLGPDLRRRAVDWALILVVSAWLITPTSRFVWDTVPLLAQTLYPWRFLAPASLAGAMLLGTAITADVRAGWRQSWLLAGITVVVIATAVPWLFLPQEPLPEDPTPADLANFELPPLFIGTTTLGEFLPRWVEELPDTAALKQQLVASGNPDRLETAAGLTVRSRSGPAYDAVYQVQVSRELTATYRQFYFPGWQAELNGQRLRLEPSTPHGLIRFRLPAGEHSLELSFNDTRPRTLGWIISAAGLLLGLLLWLKPPALLANNVPTPAPDAPASPPIPKILPLLLGILAPATWFFFAAVDTPLRRPTLRPDGVYGLPQIDPVDYAGEIRLLTFEQSAAEIAAGEPVELTLYWRALRGIGVSYQVGIQVVDEAGVVWSRSAERPYDWRFISGNDPWPPDGYRMDPFVVQLLDGTPPGEYRFHVGLVREDTGQTVDAHEIGRLQVVEPMQGNRPLEEGMIPAPNVTQPPGIRLVGTRLDRQEANPGDPLRLALLWQVTEPTQATTDQLKLEFVSASGEQLLSQTVPVAEDYLPAQWQQGDRLRTEVVTRIPATTPPGAHQWQATLAGVTLPVGQLRVNDIDRITTPPPLQATNGETLGDVATLLGANWEPASLRHGEALTVQLVWQAEAKTATSYRVFLHLIGPDGDLVTQSDGEPVNWTRPTTGWLPGEIIVDERILSLPPELPPGVYRLQTGLYDPATGARLPTNAGDAITVTSWTVR